MVMMGALSKGRRSLDETKLHLMNKLKNVPICSASAVVMALMVWPLDQATRTRLLS